MTVEIEGKERTLRFDGNAIAQVQKRFGDIKQALDEKTKVYEDQICMLTIVVNEGIAYSNYINGTHETLYTEQQIGMLLTPCDMLTGVMRVKLIGAFNETWEDKGEKKKQNRG